MRVCSLRGLHHESFQFSALKVSIPKDIDRYFRIEAAVDRTYLCIKFRKYQEFLVPRRLRHSHCTVLAPRHRFSNVGSKDMKVIQPSNTVRILVVDNNPSELEALVLGFRLEGFEAEGVPDGQVALAKLNDGDFNVVLMDLMMPGMNGVQLAREVKRRFPAITVIIMTAYPLSPVQLAKADTGVCGLVPKPCCIEALVPFILEKTHLCVSREETAGPVPNKRFGLNAPVDITLLPLAV